MEGGREGGGVVDELKMERETETEAEGDKCGKRRRRTQSWRDRSLHRDRERGTDSGRRETVRGREHKATCV